MDYADQHILFQEWLSMGIKSYVMYCKAIMLSCVLCALGSFDANAQSEVRRILGCEIQLSKNEWYENVYTHTHTRTYVRVCNRSFLECSAVRVYPFLAQMFMKW